MILRNESESNRRLAEALIEGQKNQRLAALGTFVEALIRLEEMLDLSLLIFLRPRALIFEAVLDDLLSCVPFRDKVDTAVKCGIINSQTGDRIHELYNRRRKSVHGRLKGNPKREPLSREEGEALAQKCKEYTSLLLDVSKAKLEKSSSSQGS